MKRRKVAIVEDNPADAKTMRMAIARRDPSVETILLEDGAQALDYFSSALIQGEPTPCDLILLDLNLPRVNGFEVLAFLKSKTELKKIPVLILSGSSSPEDVERCYAAGANSYLCKPTGIDEVLDMTAQILTYWFTHAKLPRTVYTASATR
jgi:two-component system, chemotaxis family, response regulator Rcp1